MLLVLFVAFRCVYAGTPHAVYGVPPVETTFGSSQPQRHPQSTAHSSGVQWVTNPYSQQPTQPWSNGYHNQPGRAKPATAYWGGAYDNYRPSTPAAYQSGVKPIPAASATYRPYSGNPNQGVTQEFYNNPHRFPPTNNHYSNQRNDPNGYHSSPGDSSRYNDFLRRYSDWYYQNAYREASTGTGYYPVGYAQPPGDPGHREPQGAYFLPAPAPGGSPASPSGVPWWLHGGFSNPAPAASYALVPRPAKLPSSTPLASSSSGGPVGPFTAPPPTKRPFPKKTSQSASSKRPGKASGASLIANRINEDSTSESLETSKSNLDLASEEKPYSGADAEATMTTGESSEAESKDTNSPPDAMTTPETATSSEEGSSPSSEESSSPSSEESSSPSSEESSSPSSEESSSPSSEESSSSSSEEGSSPSPEESSPPSTEESSPSSTEESSSPSAEESSSSSSEESSPSSTEESSSSSTEESASPSSEDNSTADNVTTESSDSSESNTIKKDD